jgi:1-aminocyclopropane-1-carboxylate deaminase
VKTQNQKICIRNSSVALFIKREDRIHPFVSGNKYRKLKYNLEFAKVHGQTHLITFGGAYSNHIAAVAFAGKENNLKTLGIIRGEELVDKIDENPTLKFAQDCGMQFKFVTREQYKLKESASFLNRLSIKYPNAYILPEGGTNIHAIKGCEEILSLDDSCFDFICCSVGTGGTVSGIINSSLSHQKVLAFPSLKGDFIQKDISKFAKKSNWEVISKYHFGGYGMVNSELIDFINQFYHKYNIPLDPIYTGKMVFGVIDLINTNYFPENSKILMIHTGGLQGIDGMNLKLKSKNLQQIDKHD